MLEGDVMHLAGAPSWQIRSGVDDALTMALYVRDVAGLGSAAPDLNLPPLQPAVHARAFDVDVVAARQEWRGWWSRALAEQFSAEDPPPSPLGWHGLEDVPAVRAVLEQCFVDFRDWSRPVKQAEIHRARSGSLLPLTHVVNGYARSLGRAVRPFTLFVREVPVEGVAGWVLDASAVVVSTGLMDDERALETFLRPVVSRLA